MCQVTNTLHFCHRMGHPGESLMEQQGAAEAQVKLMNLFSLPESTCACAQMSFERETWRERVGVFICIYVQKNKAGHLSPYLNIQFWKHTLTAGVHHSFPLAMEHKKNIKHMRQACIIDICYYRVAACCRTHSIL